MAKVQDGQQKKQRPDDSHSSEQPTKIPFSLGGVLGGLGGLIEKLGELAEAGEKLSRSGEFQDASGKIRGVYGIHVKTALGDRGEQELKVEPFGNVRRRTADEPPGEDIREPLVDIHEEDDHVLVLAEIPGVSREHVTVDLDGERLHLSARRGDTKYEKEIVLPEGFSEERMTWECNNGILKVRFER